MVMVKNPSVDITTCSGARIGIVGLAMERTIGIFLDER